MRILNIQLCAPYNEGWGYQENLLTKYQSKLGHTVKILTTCLINDTDSLSLKRISPEKYTNKENVEVERIDFRPPYFINKYLRTYINTYQKIEEFQPDFIFVHGCQFLDALKICKYLKKHPDAKCVVDNHTDFSNSAQSFLGKLLHKTLWRYTANKLLSHVYKFYGVTPARCDFLHELYNIPKNKIDLLVMGVDDDLAKQVKTQSNITGNKGNILHIISGGKIDRFKNQTLDLMDIINKYDNVHLTIFGSVSDDIRSQFNSRLSDKITCLGWLNQLDTYKALLSSDIAVFPGRHSVIWEQCVGLGIPLFVKRWKGTEHVNVCGNTLFFEDTKELEYLISDIIKNPSKLKDLKTEAINAQCHFLYSEIAKKSIS